MDRYAEDKIRKAIEIDFDGIAKAIKEECTIDEIFTEGDILAYIRDKFYPEDVFDSTKLESWAEENGYVKEVK